MKLIKKEQLADLKGTTTTIFDKTTNYLSKVSPFNTNINYDEIIDEAYVWVDEITSPGAIFTGPYTPADLRKSQTRTIRSKSGKLVAGLTLNQDWAMGSDSGIKQIPLALMLAGVITTSSFTASPTVPGIVAALGLGLYSLAGANAGELMLAALLAGGATAANQYLGGSNSLIAALTYMVPAAAIYLSGYLNRKDRAKKLLTQSRIHTSVIGDDEAMLKKLEKQIIQAIKDDAKAPFLPLVKATGKFQHLGSFESPDAGVIAGMNLSDLAQHIFIMGKPGTGKSYFIRKIIKEANLACEKMKKPIGMLLMDGKGELAFECNSILDLLINPKKVEKFCLVDGVDATKWTIIMQAINNVKFDGQNAEFARAAMELIYNSALTHQYLREINQDDPTAFSSFKWSYMYRYNLMSMILESGHEIEKNGKKEWVMGKGEIIAEMLTFHKNYETDPRIKQLIFSIENELSSERQDFAMKYLKTAQGYMQAVLQSESIIKWADSDTTDVDVLDCIRVKTEGEKIKKIGVSLPPERFGLAGALVSQLVKAQVRNGIANRDNNWRDDKKNAELLFVQDEFQDLFSEYDDLNNIPKDRSRGCYNVIATQTVSAIYSKISNSATADYLFANFSSFLSLKTNDKKATELMQEQCGTVKSFSVVTPKGQSIAFVETAQALMSKPEFDPTHPDAKMFKKFRSDIDYVVHQKGDKSNLIPTDFQPSAFSMIGKILNTLIFSPIGAILGYSSNKHIHNISTYQKDERQDYKKLYGDDMVNELDEPQHAVFVFKRGGKWVKDIGICMGVDPNFNDV
jgi:hypothetical protein